MYWAAVWKVVSSWPAAIAASVRVAWPQIKVGLAVIIATYGERLRADNQQKAKQIADVAEVDDTMRRARIDSDFVEQLRRQSGKPTDA